MITIDSPYSQFYDLDGSPLDSGYLYVGEPNEDPETTPIPLFWDRELTIPAPQPLRTLNGMIANNGSPATVYAATAYSMMVRNASMAQVFYAAYSRGESLTISDYMETLLDDPDAPAARATLGAAAAGAIASSGITMATGRVLARTTGGSGPPEEKTAAELLAFLGISLDQLAQPGDWKAFSGPVAPSGWRALPTAPTNISRTGVNAALFAAIGTTWGAGDGSTTFGSPYLPANHVPVQASGNVGTATVGEVIAHAHSQFGQNAAGLGYNTGAGANNNVTANTGSTGGTANLAAGVRVLWCVKL
ncbi:tail fiber protein [Hydrogenophaga sp.]|uniref:tail fiber protein n=1 Tax=Hydrogenophaga sp. TaxID=1904254 RepID=UPI003D139296